MKNQELEFAFCFFKLQLIFSLLKVYQNKGGDEFPSILALIMYDAL
jgi:hypothetical protein